jgi:hypothetical protein
MTVPVEEKVRIVAQAFRSFAFLVGNDDKGLSVPALKNGHLEGWRKFIAPVLPKGQRAVFCTNVFDAQVLAIFPPVTQVKAGIG